MKKNVRQIKDQQGSAGDVVSESELPRLSRPEFSLPHFSLIVPTYNAEAWLGSRLQALLTLETAGFSYEVILVDDASSDGTVAVANCFARQYLHLTVVSLAKNGGPGSARNVGMQHARGAWLLFVDCDDALCADALLQLHTHINQMANLPDAIGFDWRYSNEPTPPSMGSALQKSQRQDGKYLAEAKPVLLARYLRLQMDGSVIYTAMRRDFVQQQALLFAPGLHEDVDFIYKVYWHARQINYLPVVLYLKQQRPGSIINSISKQHLGGFVRAWQEIARFSAAQDAALWQSLASQHAIGWVGLVATRLRAIHAQAVVDLQATSDLLCDFYAMLADAQSALQSHSVRALQTRYAMIARQFFALFSQVQAGEASASIATQELLSFIGDVLKKSWSCVDLHHSLFLAPDQIRTCCKRFFVDGEMRGDVALLDVPAGQPTVVTPVRILKSKQALHRSINAAEPTACDGCPFLEFKAWPALDQLQIHYLSFEHHSVCNLKCTYCSDTYYGGKQANYDVPRLLDHLLKVDALQNCTTIVWGGGEPVVGKDFDAMLLQTVDVLPNATQRVLTNAVKHNPLVQQLLDQGRISVTTSIDAGTEATFKQVRGMQSLKRVMRNLHRYAKVSPDRVTLKYIFTEGNTAMAEVQGFVALMQDHQLLDCNFQISCDFKHETIALDDVIAMIALYGLLTDAGAGVVFFDDLLRQRLGEAHAHSAGQIRQALQDMGLGHILADDSVYPRVAIWGAGWQSRYLIEKSAFFKRVDVAYFVDSRRSRIGERFMDHDIVAPDTLLESDIPVVIAAVQNLPIIYRSFQELGIDRARLVRQLII